MKFFRSIRFRLAAWSALITGFVLLVFGAISTTLLFHEYLEMLDEEMDGFAEDLVDELEDEVDFTREDLVSLFDLFDDRDSLHLIAVVSPSGEIVFQSSRWKDFVLELDYDRPSSQQSVTRDKDRWRVWREREDGWQIFVGTQMQEIYGALIRTLVVFAIAFPLAMLLAALGGLLLARKAMRPVEAITSTAEEISVRDLDRRIPEKGLEDDELGRLTTVLNSMLDRLRTSFEQASRFSSDASHELNTPLTVMQGELEEALQREGLREEDQQLLSSILEETERLKIITRSLLLFSRSDAGNLQLDAQSVNLSETLKALVEDAAALDSAQELEFKIDLPESVFVTGDPVLMRQACHNLLLNAVRYNRENGWVKGSLSQDAERITCRISNAGPGIAPQYQEGIFDRFFREDPARSRSQGGFGLGLSLAREIVRAHGGDICLEQSDADETTFIVQLPSRTDESQKL